MVNGKLSFKVAKQIFVFVAAVAVLYICFYTYSYYRDNREEILVGASKFLEALVLPIEMAKLASQPAVESISIPVYGIRLSEIVDSWEAPRSGGRTHEGIDIFADAGTPVFAAVNGFVVRTGTNNLGGNIVYTVGPGGMRYYYAHLESIAQGIDFGTPVTTDTLIGYVGNTGNASNTPPHLHLGIYNQGAKNPYPFLIER